MKDFKKLEIWQKGMVLVEEAYAIANKLPSNEQFGMMSQIKRAAVSIPCIISEGCSRESEKEYMHYLRIAMGSCFERETLFELCGRLYPTMRNDIDEIVNKIIIQQRQIHAYLKVIASRQRTSASLSGKRRSPVHEPQNPAPSPQSPTPNPQPPEPNPMHSHFSLRYAVLPPSEVLDHYAGAGFPYALLCDVNNTSAPLDFIRLAQGKGVHAVIGVDFRNGARRCFLAIARNNEGFRQINEVLSAYMQRGEEFPKQAPDMPDCLLLYPFTGKGKLPRLRENEYVTIEPREIPRLRIWLGKHGKDATNKLLALPTMSFRNRRDFNTHRLLRAIDNNCLLSKLEVDQQAHPDDLYRSREELIAIYAELPELLQRTEELLAGCRVDFQFGTEQPHKNQQTYTGSEEEDFTLLTRLCEEGLQYRYPNANKQITDRIHKELDIIRQKGFLSYFLINWDITGYARSRGYFYVGRGSGANSVVAYILRITDVDPIELDLYFERFINLYRKNPPDFDIDFSWTDREDITRYIFTRFRHVALLAAYNTFQYRAVVRELGKVFGLPKHEIDKLSAGGFRPNELDELSRLVLKYSSLIQDFPNLLSIHAAGILISEEPIHCYTATFLPPKGYPTTHFDMIISEDVGLYKFDILSQRGLAKIKDCLDIIRRNRPLDPFIDIHDIPRFKHDERVKDLLRNAKAIGCFYVESPAMRMLLRKLQVDDYLGLVAASSVIRPGVARSGMMKEYILRYRFPERRADAHPLLLELMPETYGVMVYQEDVIKVAHYFAGLDLGEADSLRRGMSGKFRSRDEFRQAQDSFFRKAYEKGHPKELIIEIWRQVESFAGYAFAKGHSASYAVESYQSLFLKAYYPLEYMCATINNFGGFYSTELYVHEARMHGAKIEAPCVNRGSMEAVIIDKTILLGFMHVKDLESRTAEAILLDRQENGTFASLSDLVKRVHIGLEQCCTLIRSGALRFTGRHKKDLLWEAHFLLGHEPKRTPSPKLFEPPEKSYHLPALFTAEHEEAFDQIELFGFPLCDPFILLKEPVNQEVLSRELPEMDGKNVSVTGYLVTAKPTSTANGQRMFFGTFIDREGQWLDTVHFPPVAERYPFRGRGIYKITGKVCVEFDCVSIEATQMVKLPIMEDPRFSEASTLTRLRMNTKLEKKSSRWDA